MKTSNNINPNAVYFSELASKWECEHQMTEARMNTAKAFAWMAGVREGSRVLDLGCGTGVMMPAYLALGASRVVGLDVAQGMIDIASEKFANQNGVSFHCVDVLDFETDERFDAVVIFNAYPHFLDPSALAGKVASLLRPQGRFLVAHGMSRAAINGHHSSVPKEICCELDSAWQAAEVWRRFFDIDCIADTELFYCFGGTVLPEEVS